jgi:hypothetical protein
VESLFLPHRQEFSLVLARPVFNHGFGSGWQIPFNHFKCLDVEKSEELAIDSMEMRRWVVLRRRS